VLTAKDFNVLYKMLVA